MAFEDDERSAHILANCGVMVPLVFNPLEVAMLIHALRHMHNTLWKEEDGPDSPMLTLAQEMRKATRFCLGAEDE